LEGRKAARGSGPTMIRAVCPRRGWFGTVRPTDQDLASLPGSGLRRREKKLQFATEVCHA